MNQVLKMNIAASAMAADSYIPRGASFNDMANKGKDNIFFKKSFSFEASRYEEWLDGKCISSGNISAKVVCNVTNEGIALQVIGNLSSIRMINKMMCGLRTATIIQSDGRIHYQKENFSQAELMGQFNPIEPIIFHVFTTNDHIDYVRFAMTAPDRLIEFYHSNTNIKNK